MEGRRRAWAKCLSLLLFLLLEVFAFFYCTGGSGPSVQTLAHGCSEKKWDILLLMSLWLVWHGSEVAAVQIGRWLLESKRCSGLLASLLELRGEDSKYMNIFPQTLPPVSIPPQLFSILY